MTTYSALFSKEKKKKKETVEISPFLSSSLVPSPVLLSHSSSSSPLPCVSVVFGVFRKGVRQEEEEEEEEVVVVEGYRSCCTSEVYLAFPLGSAVKLCISRKLPTLSGQLDTHGDALRSAHRHTHSNTPLPG